MKIRKIYLFLRQSKNLIIYINIIAIIIVIINFASIHQSSKINEEFSTQIMELEYTENNSEIMERYLSIINEYLKLREDQKDDSIHKADLNNIEQQIDDINININNINKKIDNLNNIVDKSNDNTIISSIITGVCTIIAALIAGISGVIIAKIKVAEKNN